MRANLPHMTVPKFQFTSLGSVAEPIYLLPEAPSQFTSLARRLSVVAGVLSAMRLGIWKLLCTQLENSDQKQENTAGCANLGRLTCSSYSCIRLCTSQPGIPVQP